MPAPLVPAGQSETEPYNSAGLLVLVAVNQIDVPSDFGPLETQTVDLIAESIEDQGLLEPILVWPQAVTQLGALIGPVTSDVPRISAHSSRCPLGTQRVGWRAGPLATDRRATHSRTRLSPSFEKRSNCFPNYQGSERAVSSEFQNRLENGDDL